MARTRTFLQLELESLALADCENDTHITDADGTNLARLWVNQGIAELWRKLVRVDPDRYTVSDDMATTAGTSAYALEADFLALRRVDRIEGTRRTPLEPFAFQEAPYYAPDPRQGNGLPRYRIIGQGVAGATTQIHYDPDPGSYTYRLWYVQRPASLSADGDTFDGVAGFEDWIVCFAALRMCIRQETDPSAIMAEMARIESSITPTAANRDVGRAPRIADVRPRGR